MYRRIFIILFGLILLCSLINTNLPQKKFLEKLSKNLDEEIVKVSPGENVSVLIPIGKLLKIKVRINATTGFFTFLNNFEEISKNEKGIEFYDIKFDKRYGLYKSNEYEMIDKKLDGTGGYCVFKIKALKALDKIDFKFLTIKPWEIKKKDAESFNSIVTVSTKGLSYLE